MSRLQILQYPDNRLRQVAELVTEINGATHLIIDQMFETMYAENGIGLAATQVNIHQQIIVINILEDHKQGLVLINPKMLDKSGEAGVDEGCLSIPEQRGFVPRAKKVKIHALNRYGYGFELEANNLLAICIQHEMDHLIGKLFIDYFSPLKRQLMTSSSLERKENN